MYDALDIAAWQFSVWSGTTVTDARQKSMRLATVERLGARPVEWEDLAVEIRNVARRLSTTE
ncbi:hypothetical protein [Microbacterium sp. G2-8]|uniref:hypothetical protein n=1 Tax=Microbacterium sp. G2-8 TaxID=2842454 RepID=UPI001C8A4E9E|nr:hypothetical protein [Microbacterium sp. G2-8]